MNAGESYFQKMAYLHLFDALTLFRDCDSIEEAETGIRSTLFTAMKDENISTEAFVHLVEYAYSAM